MKLSSQALIAVLSAALVEGFVVPTSSSARRGTVGVGMASDMGEFDHLLGETVSGHLSASPSRVPAARRAVVRVPDGSDLVTLTSSVAADPSAVAGAEGDKFYDAAADLQDDPFADQAAASASAAEGGADGSAQSSQLIDDPRVRELAAKKQQKFTLQPLKYGEGKDFTDLFFPVFLPVGLLAYGAKVAFGRSSSYLADTADFKLDDYASEMVYHDGDLEEMEMCHKDYTKKLGWLGPNKKDRMIKAYLEAFAKKVSVSPRSIR